MTDKTGARVTERATLTLQMPDAGDPLGERFAELVNERSDGGVRIRIDESPRYEGRDPRAERRLAQALKAGREDIGYLPARARAADGVPAFRALLAPFAVTTYPAVQALATGPIARDALQALPDSVVGLALVPAQLRRVLANRPLRPPPRTARCACAWSKRAVGERLRGARGRTRAGPLRRRGRPGAPGGPARRRRDVAEAVLDNSYGVQGAGSDGLRGVPEVQSIVLSARAWAKLSEEQRSILRAAARDVVAAAKAIPAEEVSELAQLCRSGVHVVTPTTAQLQALVDAAAPASAGLDAKVMAALRALPGSGPHVQATRLPKDCVTPPAPRKAAPRGDGIPGGRVRHPRHEQDFRRGDVTNPTLMEDITFRTRLRAGRWSQTLDPTCPSRDRSAGPTRSTATRLRSSCSRPKSEVTAPETVRWSYFNGQLRFENVEVADFASRVLYTAHPWRKVG